MLETNPNSVPAQDPPFESWSYPKLGLFFALGLILYCLSQWLAFATRVQPMNVAIFWPPAGVMLALLVVTPPRFSWPMAAGLVAATLLCNRIAGRDLGFNVLLTLNDVFVGVVGALLYRRWIGAKSPVSGTKPYGYFLLLVATSALLSATIGSVIVQSTFDIRPTDVWHHWFGAMTLGLLVGTPLLILAREPLSVLGTVKIDIEFLVVFTITSLLLAFAHIEILPSPTLKLASVILLVPMLLWIAVRRSAFETAAILAMTTCFKIYALSDSIDFLIATSWSANEGVSWFMLVFAIQCGAVLMLASYRAEQMALEHDKTEQAARMRSIINAANDGVISITPLGVVETFSQSAERLFGYDAGEVIGKNVKMLMPDSYSVHHDGYLKRYMDTDERRIIGIGRLVTGRRKDGTEFPMELSVGEARHGQHRVFTGFIRDVTERQKTEQRLHELQDELLHVSRLSAMGELASALAHELNQPLTAIKNYAQAAGMMLKSGKDVAELPSVLAKTVEQANRAGDIIKRLRSFVTARQVERTPQKVSKLIEEACALALIGAREDGIKSRIVHGENMPEVQVDRIQIQQILINLVRNAVDAVRQSAVREITVTSTRVLDAVVINVADTGSGITEQGEFNLFKPFMTTKPSGMGIGLSLSRSIAEAHGGTLVYGRNPVGGAVFTLTLPIEPTSHAS